MAGRPAKFELKPSPSPQPISSFFLHFLTSSCYYGILFLLACQISHILFFVFSECYLLLSFVVIYKNSRP